MEVVVSNLRYYLSTFLVKPVGVAHIPAKPIFKKGEKGLQLEPVHCPVPTSRNSFKSSAFSCTSHEKLIKPSHFQCCQSVTCLC